MSINGVSISSYSIADQISTFGTKKTEDGVSFAAVLSKSVSDNDSTDESTVTAFSSTKSSSEKSSSYSATMSELLHNKSNKDEVANVVKTLATTSDDELVAIHDNPDGSYYLTYSSTGQPVTSASSASFKEFSASALAGRTAIYNEEIAKGTDPADIFDKIVSYMNTQPQSYLDVINWS
ncbi:hypothetical protein JMY81_15490 [Brenneria goodwinii]|uniref:hypothetical protein n=1 Tax=Brenneria goodwinii TaxID=1109412 RepID=UPI00065E350B|nr:hypothetical protein [Brenneria goodwinii]MCG8157261.1 hypothetical protein [Brenneria goodwinii]MCG8162215.1 hypothetical protein [Brenneria goodwinii]MCG8166145.1 hypothetical protein [Brenneria goodwinii]MCG8170772.1 hypothetical protein [Brenneria goodwinii]MCG8175841.1 hypothetical protein [Brenneria goodwinii]